MFNSPGKNQSNDPTGRFDKRELLEEEEPELGPNGKPLSLKESRQLMQQKNSVNNSENPEENEEKELAGETIGNKEATGELGLNRNKPKPKNKKERKKAKKNADAQSEKNTEINLLRDEMNAFNEQAKGGGMSRATIQAAAKGFREKLVKIRRDFEKSNKSKFLGKLGRTESQSLLITGGVVDAYDLDKRSFDFTDPGTTSLSLYTYFNNLKDSVTNAPVNIPANAVILLSNLNAKSSMKGAANISVFGFSAMASLVPVGINPLTNAPFQNSSFDWSFRNPAPATPGIGAIAALTGAGSTAGFGITILPASGSANNALGKVNLRLDVTYYVPLQLTTIIKGDH